MLAVLISDYETAATLISVDRRYDQHAAISFVENRDLEPGTNVFQGIRGLDVIVIHAHFGILAPGG